MALDKATLKTTIKTLSETLFENTGNMTPDQARDFFAQGLADAIEVYVKSGDGVYVLGSLQAGANPVTPNATVQIKMQ